MKKTFFELISKDYPELTKDNLVDIMKKYQDWKHSSINYYCAVCDKELTDEEISTISPYDFSVVCKSHIEYRNSFKIDLVRLSLGYRVDSSLLNLI